MSDNNDSYFMEVALRLARRSLGVVAPNPAVGCVIVKDGNMVGRGWTAPGGRPHGETQAIERAGENTKGATAYVTLEPCCHEGKTPPCTDALINAGIKRAVIATTDPYEKVNGKGIKTLEDVGIDVEVGVGKEEAEEINKGFFLRIKEKRPFVTLKLAVSEDGKIGKPGERIQISGEKANRFSHLLRKQHDAIMVGGKTIEVDKPQLTCRLPGLENTSPIRVEAGHDIKKRLHELAEQGITRLLVEGGAKLATSFLDSGLVDQIIIIKNPEFEIGEDGIPAPEINKNSFEITQERKLGNDCARFFARKD